MRPTPALRGCWRCWRQWVCSKDSPLREEGVRTPQLLDLDPVGGLPRPHAAALTPTASWLNVGRLPALWGVWRARELATTWSHWREDPQSSRETRAGRHVARRRRLTQRGSRLVAPAVLENSAWYQKPRLVDLPAAGSGHFLRNTHLDRWSMLTRLESPRRQEVGSFYTRCSRPLISPPCSCVMDVGSSWVDMIRWEGPYLGPSSSASWVAKMYLESLIL